MSLTPKQQVFVEEYLTTWNASEAARRAQYAKPGQQGHRLLKNVEIDAEIARRVAEKAMTANEVLVRLAEHARGDMGAWLTNDGEIDIAAMKLDGKTRLLRKVKRTYRSGETEAGGTWEETRVEVELHDAQAALVHLGKHHGLFNDKTEHVGEVTIRVKYADEGTDGQSTTPAPETA